METTATLLSFFETIEDDPRICPVHIAIYLALLSRWQENGGGEQLEIATYELMRVCKVLDRGTYLRRLRELAQFGYLYYEPAENDHVKGRVKFRRL
jgi:hypothetical protein